MTTRSTASRLLLASVLGLFLFLPSCNDSDDPAGPEGSSIITLSFQRLERLEGGLNYQVWAVKEETGGSVTGYPVGIFNMSAAGQIVTTVSGSLITGGFEAPLDAEDVFAVGLSIESSYSVVNSTSGIFLLGGAVVGGQAQMATDFWFGIGLDLTGVQGRYVLGTPTDEDPENELSGLWFLDPFQGPSEPGLQLPIPTDGWDYEGWVVIDGQPVSTGKFYQADVADASFRYGGPLPGPTVPGEDFLRNAPSGLTFPTDLSGTEVFITMEPWQQWDLSPNEPFFVRLLQGDIPNDAAPGTVYGMTSVSDQLPRGTATVQ